MRLRVERTFRHGALQAWIERVSREEREHIRLSLESLIITIVIHQCLEARKAPDGLGRGGIYMVDIVVVEEAEVWRGSDGNTGGVCELFVGAVCH